MIRHADADANLIIKLLFQTKYSLYSVNYNYMFTIIFNITVPVSTSQIGMIILKDSIGRYPYFTDTYILHITLHFTPQYVSTEISCADTSAN